MSISTSHGVVLIERAEHLNRAWTRLNIEWTEEADAWAAVLSGAKDALDQIETACGDFVRGQVEGTAGGDLKRMARREERARRCEGDEAGTLAAKATQFVRFMQGEATDAPSLTFKPVYGKIAVIIRAGDPLPLPSEITGISSIGLKFAKRGDRIKCGEYVIVRTQKRVRSAGYHYNLWTCDPDGRPRMLSCDGAIKAEIKKADIHRAILAGKGELAAVVRRIHAEFAGFKTEIERDDQLREFANYHAAVDRAERRAANIEVGVIADDEVDVLVALGHF